MSRAVRCLRSVAVSFAAVVLGTAGLGTMPAHAADPTWKAGAAKVAITPDKLMWMSGYGARTMPAEGTLHDLWAKALVLEDGSGKRAVLLTLDLVGIPRDISTRICDRLRERHSLPRESVWINTSHTHCGPVVGTNLLPLYGHLTAEQKQEVEEYAKKLEEAAVRVVGEAIADLQPAKVSSATGKATFAVNRRNNKEPDVPALREAGKLVGPVDHDLPVLAVHRADGTLRAVVCTYACHATVLSFYKWCGDYPGFAMRDLEKNHPGAVALFCAGCGADQNPLPRRTVELAEKYGRELADGVEAVLKMPLDAVAPKLAARYEEIALPFGPLPSREDLVRESMDADKFVRARAGLLLAELESKKSLSGTYPYPVQAWQLGRDLTIVTLGGEVVVDYALRIKQELGAGTVVAGYSNDVMAYIPSLRVLKEGGYEGARSMIYYGQPTVWGPEVEERIVEAVHRSAKQVRSAAAK